MADSSDSDSENWAPATPATQDDLASAILYDKSSIAAGGPQKPRPRSAPTSPVRREERASSLTPPAQRPPRTAPQSAPRRLTAPRNPDRGRPHAAPVTPNHRAVRPARTAGARRLRSSVERVQQLARAPQLAMIAAQDLPEKLKTTRVAAVRHARQERSITNGQYYLLLVAALLLTGTASARAAYLMFEWGVRGMAWSRALWSMQHEEFRVWTAVTCADPWQAETVLCQAAGGSWIARELIRAKVATAGEDHCSKDSKGDGCRWALLTGGGGGLRKGTLRVPQSLSTLDTQQASQVMCCCSTPYTPVGWGHLGWVEHSPSRQARAAPSHLPALCPCPLPLPPSHPSPIFFLAST